MPDLRTLAGERSTMRQVRLFHPGQNRVGLVNVPDREMVIYGDASRQAKRLVLRLPRNGIYDPRRSTIGVIPSHDRTGVDDARYPKQARQRD
jgi:hypothetical protein